MLKIFNIIILSACGLLLSACSGFFDKDNTPKPSPLTHYKAEIKIQPIWKTRTNRGVGNDYLKLAIAVNNHAVFTADKNGTLTATNKLTGKKLWSISTRLYNTAGPVVGENSVVICSREGDIAAFNQTNGFLLWQSKISSEVLAKPAIANGIVIVKAIDGKTVALSENTGQPRWQYHQMEPVLILRGASAPLIRNDYVIVGFANGSLIKLTLANGGLLWRTPITIPEGSFAIQRMIDIDADPVIYENTVYVATYQGRLASLDLLNGK